jgi:hypothetical protein
MHGLIDPTNQQTTFASELWSVPNDWQVYGLWQDPHQQWGLIVVQADQRTVAVVRVGAIDVCYQASAEIAQLSIDDQRIAMILTDGQFLLWSLAEPHLYIQYS